MKMTNKKIPNSLIKNTLKYIEKEAKDNGVKFVVSSNENITLGKIKCSGYFMSDSKPPILTFATGKPTKDWIVVAVHESCHMNQWSENSDVWNNLQITKSIEASTYIAKWLNGKQELKDSVLRKCIYASLDVELDCEKRCLKKFKKLGISEFIDKTEYIQKSNAYVFFYLAMYRTKKVVQR